MRTLVALVALSLLGLAAPASAADGRERWDTRVFAMVEEPGFPAYAFVHRNGRVYGGTYTNPQGDSTPSLVREWRADGTLQRTWRVPGQDLSQDHGVQVANADRRGRLVLLETSKARVMTLSTRTGRFRTWARLPDLPGVEGAPIPNYATWGRGGRCSSPTTARPSSGRSRGGPGRRGRGSSPPRCRVRWASGRPGSCTGRSSATS